MSYSICLSLSDISVSIMLSKFIYTAANGKFHSLYGQIAFHCVCVYVCVCVYTPHLLIHSPVDRHLDCFHTLAIVSKFAMNTEVCISFQINNFYFFPDTYPDVESQGHMVFLFLVFEKLPYW